jgi:hypothetical protein
VSEQIAAHLLDVFRSQWPDVAFPALRRLPHCAARVCRYPAPLDCTLKHSLQDRQNLAHRRVPEIGSRQVRSEPHDDFRIQVAQPYCAEPWQYVRIPVSRAHRSTLLQCQTDERPSFPSGLGKPGPPARTFTR